MSELGKMGELMSTILHRNSRNVYNYGRWRRREMSEQLDRYKPSELDDEVGVCLGFEVADLEAKLEAMERELRRLKVAVAAREVTIKTERQLAASQQEREE